MLERGANIQTVQELLGHSDVRTTEVYTHVLNQRVVSPLDGLLSRDRDKPAETASFY